MKLINVPPTKEVVAESIRQVGSEHLNKFIILFGTVVRTGHIHSRELFKEFMCKSCEKKVVCESDVTEYNRFNLPAKCNGKVETKVNPFFKIAKSLMEKMKSKSGEAETHHQASSKANTDFQTSECKSRTFVPVEGTSEYSDY